MCRENLIDFSCYEVYDDGRLWSKHWDRLVVGTMTDDGYVRVCLKCSDNKTHNFLLHRVIYFYYKGDIPDDVSVNHIDENKQNNSIGNLNLLTHQDNCNWGTRNKRISEAHKGRKIGSPSEDTKRKLSETQKKRLSNEEERAKMYRPIWQYRDGELVAIYKSVKEASDKTGFAKGAISSASRGVLNKQGNHKLGEYIFYNAAQF